MIKQNTWWAAANEENERFQRAIGKLVLAFSDFETMMYRLLLHCANVSDDVGRAIFSGTRARLMIGHIRAIAHNTKMEADRVKDLEEIFSQVNSVNTMRDFVIHHVYGSRQEFNSDDPSTRVITDLVRVRQHGKARRLMIGSSHLEAMASDLITACWRLQAHTDRSNVPFRIAVRPDGKPYTWLYKSPQPDNKNQPEIRSSTATPSEIISGVISI